MVHDAQTAQGFHQAQGAHVEVVEILIRVQNGRELSGLVGTVTA